VTNIIPFNFDGHPVRAVNIDGEPHMVGKDVAERLGYADPTTAIKSHCRGVQKLHPILDTLGRVQNVRVLAEADVMRLIIGSKLPAAQRFEAWLFEEVLPSIRRTGSYGVPAAQTPAQIMASALLIADQTLKQQAHQIVHQAVLIEELAPKAAELERIAAADGSMCVTDAAKVLKIRPKQLFDWLKAHRWIYRRAGNNTWVGYQDKTAAGHLEHRVATCNLPDGSTKIVEQVMLTGKGIAKLSGLVNAVPQTKAA
jgi:anti-repressor protein